MVAPKPSLDESKTKHPPLARTPLRGVRARAWWHLLDRLHARTGMLYTPMMVLSSPTVQFPARGSMKQAQFSLRSLRNGERSWLLPRGNLKADVYCRREAHLVRFRQIA